MRRVAAILIAVLSIAAAADPDVVPAHAVPGTHTCRRYPDAARKANESGTATVRFDVDATGRIDNVVLWRSSGHPLLDQTAIICVGLDWREYPATRDGVPAASPNHFAAVEFRLVGTSPVPAAAPVATLRRAPEEPAIFDNKVLTYLGLSGLIAALLVAIGVLADIAMRTRRDGGN